MTEEWIYNRKCFVFIFDMVMKNKNISEILSKLSSSAL